MRRTVYLHPITINLKPYPWWERFRVAYECLVWGRVEFRAELTDVKSGPPSER
jgi:hypothetical protein